MQQVSTAYVLAAGLGTRLRPLTNERCKPLVEVCGTPLVEFALGLLERAGVRRVGINSHWLHPQLPQALGPSFRSLALTYTHEPEVLGTGGGLRGLCKALPPPPGEKVLVMNADALIDIDLAALVEDGARHPEALATLVLKEVPDVKSYGVIGTDADDVVVDFAGRARTGGAVARERMFCGVHLVDPRAFSILPDVAVTDGVARGPMSGINDEGYPAWMKSGEIIRGFDITGTFCDVGTPERLLEANLALLDGTWSSAHLQKKSGVHPTARVEGTLVGACVVDAGAVIERGAHVERSVLGRNARVAAGARVVRSVLQSGAVVREAAELVHAVVSPTTTWAGPLAPGGTR